MTYTETELMILGVHAMDALVKDGQEALEKFVDPYPDNERALLLLHALVALMEVASVGIQTEDLERIAAGLVRRVGPPPVDDGDSFEGFNS